MGEATEGLAALVLFDHFFLGTICLTRAVSRLRAQRDAALTFGIDIHRGARIGAGTAVARDGPPAQFKAYIDNIVRVGRTFGYHPGGRIGDRNHVEASVRTAFAYIGVTDVHEVAVEYDEFADHRLAESIRQAEARVDALALELDGGRDGAMEAYQDCGSPETRNAA